MGLARAERGEPGEQRAERGDRRQRGLRFVRLDQEAEAAGQRVLNLFCYTATISVYAARGGAVG